MCTKLRLQAGLGKELAGSGKRPEGLLDSLGRHENGLPDHEEVVFDLRGASVYHDDAGRWNCTEWQHADFNYADELAKGHRRRSGSLHGHGSRSVSFRREATIPVERWPSDVPPGARSAWHTHPLGQILIVTDGVGWVQQWGGPVQVIRKGDIVWIPAGVKHWHGATPTTTMTHIAFQEQLDGRAVDWLERVTDEQYRLTK